MIIFPAIDLKDGQAVRLTKGEMLSAKIYSNEPYLLAKSFEEMGAEWLHLVDLNGAFAGEPKNLEQIKKIRSECNLKIEIGGGIRDEETIQRYMDLGVDRVILGSIAQKDPHFTKAMAAKYPVAVGIDAKDGYVAVQGWGDVSSVKATDLASEYAGAGVEAIICTDIGRDGTLSGINVAFTLEIARASGVLTIASGGLKDENDLNALRDSGEVGGVIVGKAFYEGTIDLKACLNRK